ncbi:hypothetical protein J2W49_000650 [Hydrogenophaga palleronii]|uniref:Uncharacterized protein n=1 Tax=Hydrogenophaga palleronii TaxID=65655 RepID=A0ABU1WHI8_9BURK|nr:hypothetical protein [Hydrogenophaga palleronii]
MECLSGIDKRAADPDSLARRRLNAYCSPSRQSTMTGYVPGQQMLYSTGFALCSWHFFGAARGQANRKPAQPGVAFSVQTK